MRIFLCGDVMLGRGIDQILAHPGAPDLYESWAKSALRYVELAETHSGSIPRGVEPTYVWGDALQLLDEARVDARIINLENAVTVDGLPWPGKGIHYRMHPRNVDVLTSASVDCCALANNHVLDWSHPGLEQTLSCLREARIQTVGAGSDLDEATEPAIVDSGSGSRVVVTAIGLTSSGIPGSWGATDTRPGVSLAVSLDHQIVTELGDALALVAGPADVRVVSIHWGPNWGYEIPSTHRRLAHALIDQAKVDIVHGHSSHHPLGIEIYRNRLILYGCGDLLNDYEGIGGHEQFRPDLRLLYLVDVEPGFIHSLEMIPMSMRRFRLERASNADAVWLARKLTLLGSGEGTSVQVSEDGRLAAAW